MPMTGTFQHKTQASVIYLLEIELISTEGRQGYLCNSQKVQGQVHVGKQSGGLDCFRESGPMY